MSHESGQMLLHYRLVERIGEGGMGVVWKAVDTTLDREVAIKILPDAFAADPERLARFEREAKLLASLNHPNIAAVYGLHEVASVTGAGRALRFLAMELIRGRPLTREIAQGLAPGRVVELAVAIADALAVAHRQNVVHRDLKPDNIMIDQDGRPKVLDFGLAKLGAVTTAPEEATIAAGASVTRQGSLLGTVAYMSPEQAQGKAVDPRSDVFSLGIVLYEMATGRRPFQGDNSVSVLSAILRDTPPAVTELQPAAPAPLGRIIFRCLEKKPEARYADAAGLRDDLRALQGTLISDPGLAALSRRRSPRRWLAVGVMAVVALAALGGWWYRQSAKERWVRKEAIPELERIVDRIQGLEEGRESWDAFILGRRIEAMVPGDPLFERLRPKFMREFTITSDPPGATVLARYYDEPDVEPIVVGTTPLTKHSFSRGFTRVRLTLAGQQPIDDIVWNSAFIGDAVHYTFQPTGTVAEDEAWVPGGSFELYLPGLDHLKPEPMGAFTMDRHEVTNRQYQLFVAAGGYRDAKYWPLPFVDGGRTLSATEAMARFTDRTGQPGPATWEVGAFTEGHGEDPVTGISWYEAAAYAEWAGKRLPTIFHWNRVAFTVGSSRIAPPANLAGDGVVPVGSTKSANRYGVSDLAGNAREWVWNASGDGLGHFILGGGWNDPEYAFVDAYAQPPFDRSATNGFRCIRLLEAEPNLAVLERSVDRPRRDFYAEQPVSDDVFAQYLRQFSYDKAPLEARIEEEKQVSTGIRQRITFAAAYGGERMTAYLFLPAQGTQPYQVVVFFPGSGATTTRSSETLELGRIDFVAKNGRAVLWPIFKGTYERGGELTSDYAKETTFYKDYVIMWGKDLARAIDYAETRTDLDTGRLAYYGLSWGGGLGAIMPAVEPRVKANILYVAGLGFQRALPEVDQINYVGRVKQPTLILNGELDFFFPAETSQKPLFDLLGTPAADKKRLVFPGGHSVPRVEMIRESLQWLDRYLGPVAAP